LIALRLDAMSATTSTAMSDPTSDESSDSLWPTECPAVSYAMSDLTSDPTSNATSNATSGAVSDDTSDVVSDTMPIAASDGRRRQTQPTMFPVSRWALHGSIWMATGSTTDFNRRARLRLPRG
jgi:hypothetical protein